MKKITEMLSLKIVAVLLSYLMVVVCVLSSVATFIMGYYKFYFSNEETVKQEIMYDMARNEVNYVSSLIYMGKDLTNYYKDKNIYFEIYDKTSNVVIETNYNGEEYLVFAEDEHYEYVDIKKIDEYGNEYWTVEEEQVSTIKLYIAKDMTKNDLFSVTIKIIELGFRLQYTVIVILLVSFIILIALWCYLFCASGHRSEGIIATNFLDKIPFDLFTAVVTLAAIISIILVDALSYKMATFVLGVFFIGSIDYFVGLFYLLSFATRIKTKTLIKNNLIYYFLQFLYKRYKKFSCWIKYIFSNISLVYKTVLVVACPLILEIIFTFYIFNRYWRIPELYIFIIIFINLIIILGSLYLAITMQMIKQGGEKIAGGELQHKIDTKYMVGDFKNFSESLNNINDGLQTAVNERIKSERLKTELITNVSHDIKTPLTSIINYVDLIKKEGSENDTLNGYIEVLERQSIRLKKLVEDLVEASKASTGNISLNLMPCDVGVLLNQTVGEFEDRLIKNKITPIVNITETPVKVMADGRHLWRVFDNLMTNVCKYALCGTRVYLDLKECNDKAVITFRNISKYELNISSEELMERFVRGDSSRNTEGSGLGLSIAKSLVELQNGNMLLDVDGDLFKVTVELPIIK